jgi:type II restriction enzyme
MTVSDVQIIHRACITESCLKKRNPLSQTARRAGWQGCNFLLDQIPTTARINVVMDGEAQSKEWVLQQWQMVQQLLRQPMMARGWTADVLRIVERLNDEFSLTDVYAHSSELGRLHPQNSHIAPKIRQQLQVLRNTNLILFLGQGRYRKSTSITT